MIPKGFGFASVNAGVKAPEVTRLDMGLITCDCPAAAAAVFTTNRVKAAPVIIGQELIRKGTGIKAVLINAGNANACTGADGLVAARALMQGVAEELGIAADQVLPMSTGVIGVALPLERMLAKIPVLVAARGQNPEGFTTAIMTTDTFPKTAMRQAGAARVFGTAKGAGMIAPNMATMLAIILTDAQVTAAELDAMIRAALPDTLNAITVDGDTSTNDTLVALASGKVAADHAAVAQAIREVMLELALMIVQDGEGATKLVKIMVTGAASDTDAHHLGKAVANSLLVKTALFGQDPNWGRILCALGYSGVAFDPAAIAIDISGMPTVRGGMQAPGFDEQAAHAALKPKEIEIAIAVGAGNGSATVWTTDLSYKYVEINASYRT